MRLTLLATVFALFVQPFFAFCQKPAAPIAAAWLSPKDSLYLSVDEAGRKIIGHTVKPKQTLFSLAKFYGLSLEELYEFNPDFRTNPTLEIGQRVRVPIPNLAIKRYKNSKFEASKNAVIYYVVQDGETLYQICKRNFDMPVDTILRRNRLKNTNIRPGQLIQMGWMSTEGVPLKWRKSRPPTPASELKTQFNRDKARYREAATSGVCFWQRDSNEKGDLYALHREAAIGTTIAVTNPMSRKTVHAKVIGRIPAGHDKNTEVILSPAAARSIGAKDPKFFVKLRYMH